MDRDTTRDQEKGHVPATNRDVDVPTDEDYDHTGQQRKEDLPGGNRGGGNPDSTLGR